MICLTSLPPELIVEVLHYLPIKTLLDFGSTSRQNRELQLRSLASLRLGVFHSRLSGMINLMEATARNDFVHSVQMVLPRKGSKNKECIMHMQNTKIQSVIETYQHSLRDLEIGMWDLHEATAHLLAGLANLRHLSIRLDHPHTRHPAMKQGYWQESPGSTVWNLLAPRVGKSCALGRLRTLNLERAGITDYQLRALLEGNPYLKELRLRKCFNLTRETFKFLSSSKVGQGLETFHFTMVSNERINDRILGYVSRMTKLKSLSLHGCRNVDCKAVQKMNKQMQISELILPTTPEFSAQDLEVDPAYR